MVSCNDSQPTTIPKCKMVANNQGYLTAYFQTNWERPGDTSLLHNLHKSVSTHLKRPIHEGENRARLIKTVFIDL
jgi:hypothetical protein